jgi:hypothetical protein
MKSNFWRLKRVFWQIVKSTLPARRNCNRSSKALQLEKESTLQLKFLKKKTDHQVKYKGISQIKKNKNRKSHQGNLRIWSRQGKLKKLCKRNMKNRKRKRNKLYKQTYLNKGRRISKWLKELAILSYFLHHWILLRHAIKLVLRQPKAVQLWYWIFQSYHLYLIPPIKVEKSF